MQSKTLDRVRDELQHVKEDLLSTRGNLTSCQGELENEKESNISRTPQGAGIPPRQLGRSDGLGPGQLPDINPAAVSVVRKETHGAGLIIEEVVGGNMVGVS